MSFCRDFKYGFTLVELLTIVVIIGILTTFAISTYLGTKRKVREKVVKTSLVLIQAAERNHRIEARSYIEAEDTIQVNQNLRLDIPASGYWEYSVPEVSNDDPAAQTFCAQAVAGEDDNVEAWHITQADTEASEGACED